MIDGTALQCATIQGNVDALLCQNSRVIGTLYNSLFQLQQRAGCGIESRYGRRTLTRALNYSTFTAIGNGDIDLIIQIQCIIGRSNCFAV